MKNLFKALSEFQNKCPVILKDSTAQMQKYSYKYTDLPAIFKVINPLLKEHGLVFTQLVNQESIKTILFHIESGDKLESDTELNKNVELQGQNAFQTLGSQITYLRRYALSSMLGIITDKDTDAAGEQERPVKKPVDKTPDQMRKEIPALIENTSVSTQSTIDRMQDEYKTADEAKLTRIYLFLLQNQKK